MATYFAKLTTVGLARLAEAQATYTPLVFTELAVGDGGGSPITPDASMTELVNEVARVSVNSTDRDPADPNKVRVEGLIPAATGGFTIREAGLFNVEGELLAIASYPDMYKTELSDGVIFDAYIRIVIAYENATDSIEISTDTSVIVATRQYVDNLRKQLLFGGEYRLREHFERSTVDAGIWTLGSTGGSSNPTIAADSAADGRGAVHPLSVGSGTSFVTSISRQIGTNDFGFSSRARVTDGGDAENLGGFVANNAISVSGSAVVRFVTGATNWKAVVGGTAYDTGVPWGAAYQDLLCLRVDGTIYFYIDGVLVHSEAHAVDMGAATLQAKCSAGGANDGSMFNDTLDVWIATA